MYTMYKEKYDDVVKRYIIESEKNGSYLKSNEVGKIENLPDYRWFIYNCPDKNVKTWKDFVRWCGFFIAGTSTKEDTIKFIYRMEKELGRPLKLEDFNGVGCYKVSMNGLKKYWKNLNEMKLELGLKINQENMISKTPTKESFDRQIERICEIAKGQNNIFTLSDLQYHDELLKANALRKYSKIFYNMTLRELLAKKNVSIGNIGDGQVYYFKDGEVAKSTHEYIFSTLLKENGYVFGVDYIRDVRYSSFIPKYSGYMDCDYVLLKGSEPTYIEIAGVLRDYKSYYYNDKEIKSKTKEKYRLTLKEKENMFIRNKLKYIILFPSDLRNKTLDEILKILI